MIGSDSCLTLGSLFDGSGGFPLAALNVGVRPVWAAEVEPFPILVTTTRLPDVQHLGDVNTIDGGDIEPVDVVTFGSPCQDLSVAGRQAGLAGERSGLFFQAVRIMKEMREASNDQYPRFAVWENVPGAFYSNRGADFAAVLASLTRIAQPQAPTVPVPDNGWATAGVLMGGGCSVAWRVLDAQYFGVPQRRRRIYAVCDFAGHRAPEILFEPDSMPGHSGPGGTQTQNHATTPERSVGDRRGECGVMLLDHHPQASRLTVNETGVMQTLTARMANSPTNVPILLDQPAGTDSSCGCGARRVFGLNSIHQSHTPGGHYGYEARVSKTLDVKGGRPTSNQGGMVILEPELEIHSESEPPPVYAASKSDFFTRATKNQAGALLATDYTDPPIIGATYLRPRRLTPLECARLQGFPDHWCDNLAITDPTEDQLDYWVGVWARWNQIRGVKPRTRRQVAAWLANPVSDSALYKLWGNGVALPVVEHVLTRLAAYANSGEDFFAHNADRTG